MSNKWAMFVKDWASKNNTTYSCAMTDPKCKEAYKKENPAPSKSTKRRQKLKEQGLNPYKDLDKQKLTKTQMKKLSPEMKEAIQTSIQMSSMTEEERCKELLAKSQQPKEVAYEKLEEAFPDTEPKPKNITIKKSKKRLLKEEIEKGVTLKKAPVKEDIPNAVKTEIRKMLSILNSIPFGGLRAEKYKELRDRAKVLEPQSKTSGTKKAFKQLDELLKLRANEINKRRANEKITKAIKELNLRKTIGAELRKQILAKPVLLSRPKLTEDIVEVIQSQPEPSVKETIAELNDADDLPDLAEDFPDLELDELISIQEEPEVKETKPDVKEEFIARLDDKKIKMKLKKGLDGEWRYVAEEPDEFGGRIVMDINKDQLGVLSGNTFLPKNDQEYKFIGKFGNEGKAFYESWGFWEEEEDEEDEDEIEGEGLSKACWKGYEAIGMKKKGKKVVPNCVPIKGGMITPEGTPPFVTPTGTPVGEVEDNILQELFNLVIQRPTRPRLERFRELVTGNINGYIRSIHQHFTALPQGHQLRILYERFFPDYEDSVVVGGTIMKKYEYGGKKYLRAIEDSIVYDYDKYEKDELAPVGMYDVDDDKLKFCEFDDVPLTLKKFKYRGKMYLKNKATNIVYDYEAGISGETKEVGIFDPEKKIIRFLQEGSLSTIQEEEEDIDGGAIADWVSPTAWKEYATAVVKGRNDYPPKMRDIIEKYGKVPILKMYACRTPVPSLLTSALNAVSLGAFSQKWSNQPYDKLFHLDLRIELATRPQTTILLEKNEVLNALVNPKPPGKDTECNFIPKNKQITILQLLEGAKQIQGDKFFKYSAYNNNCQDFIMALLKGSGLGTQENYDFIKQNTQELFKGLPGTRKFANTITDIAAVADTIIQGAAIHKGENYYIQSVVFDKNKFDVKSSRKWLKENNYETKKPDVTDTQIRWRQVNPTYIKDKGFTKFRTKKIGRKSGISLIISYK